MTFQYHARLMAALLLTAFACGGEPPSDGDAAPAAEAQAPAAAPAPKPQAPAAKPETQAPAPSQKAAAPPPARRPSQADIEQCNTYAYQAQKDAGRIVRDGAIGAAVGAGVGAAGGAIADGGSGAGKGAAIGAIVGAAGGTLYGFDQESKRSAAAEQAYRECMIRLGY